MVSPPLRRLVSPRRNSSTSSISDSDDEDSIGPLPVLKRNNSLVVRRTARTASGKESGRKPRREKKPDSTSTTCRPPVRRRSIDTPPSHYFSSGRRHMIETSERVDFNEDDAPSHLPSRPRRTQSLQATNDWNSQQELLEQCQQVPKRRASVQPGAATQLSLSKRPDPPEQIRPGISTESRRKGVFVVKSSKKTILHDPLYRSKSLKAPRRPRRTASMPLFGRSAVQKHSSKPQKDHRDGDPIVKNDGLFSAARRSHSIAKSFSRSKGVCNDVWVERMVVRDGKDPQVFFKSVFSKECKYEPPTGALVSTMYQVRLTLYSGVHLSSNLLLYLSFNKERYIHGRASQSSTSQWTNPSTIEAQGRRHCCHSISCQKTEFLGQA
jgi:hypothetical protein